MKNTDIPTVIYSVPELEAVFSRLAREQTSWSGVSLQQIQADINTSVQIATSLAVISQFCNSAFIGLKAVPAELATASDPDTKPFYEAYRANQFILMTTEEANQFPSAICRLG